MEKKFCAFDTASCFNNFDEDQEQDESRTLSLNEELEIKLQKEYLK